jgi:hypothetical protein
MIIWTLLLSAVKYFDHSFFLRLICKTGKKKSFSISTAMQFYLVRIILGVRTLLIPSAKESKKTTAVV